MRLCGLSYTTSCEEDINREENVEANERKLESQPAAVLDDEQVGAYETALGERA